MGGGEGWKGEGAWFVVFGWFLVGWLGGLVDLPVLFICLGSCCFDFTCFTGWTDWF